jgi:hypothetical protein
LIKLLYLDSLVRQRPDTFGNRLGTDPYASGVGGRGIKTPFLSLLAV